MTSLKGGQMSRVIPVYTKKAELKKLVSELLKTQPDPAELKSFCKKLEIPFSKDPVQLMTTVLTSFDDISREQLGIVNPSKKPKGADL